MNLDSIKIDKLRMLNYKRFKDASVDFDPSLTVISGKNGAGKSSVLSAVAVFLSWIIARLRNENGVGNYVHPLSVNNHAHNGCVVGRFFDAEATIPNKAKSGYSKQYSWDIAPIKGYVAQKRTFLEKNEATPIPVFAYYGVKRAVLDMPLRTRQHEYTKFDAYDKCLEGAANFRGFFTWFRACEDWENEQNSRGGSNIQHPGLRAFRNAMSQFMPEYTNVRIDRHPLRMTLQKRGEWLNAEQLSDGEKIYLALIGDLCHRLSLANPSGNPLEGDGIVLIDEIDLHLHPQWQGEIASALTRTFPNIQFIVTTHSPHVINSVPTSSIRMIDSDASISSATYAYGIPSEIILEDIMHLSNDVPVEIEDIISNFNDAIGEANIDTARSSLNALEEKVPLHPELARMRKLFERIAR